MQSPLKWYGGKTPLGTKLAALAPAHLHRVHAYGGGLGEFWNWPHEDVSEVVNDINHLLTNFFRVLQSNRSFSRFKRKVNAIPFSEVEWDRHYAQCGRIHSIPRTSVAAAVSFFVCCRQSRSGECNEFAPLSRNRLRRNRNEQVSAWLTAIEGLPATHRRLLRVVIKEMPATDLIRKEDTPNTLFYLDPPYLHTTRTATNVFGRNGEHEMTEEQHEELLQLITGPMYGKFMLSGYNSALYASYLRDWRKVEFIRANNVAGGKSKRRMIECVWMNYSE